MSFPKVPLKLIPAPGTGSLLIAPPVLNASDHSIDYTCGHCGAVLLHADTGQVHGLVIRCTACGSYNSTVKSFVLLRATRPGRPETGHSPELPAVSPPRHREPLSNRQVLVGRRVQHIFKLLHPLGEPRRSHH
jgi:DNA-directed RNA polymerase subunit RPC12/RpoP